MLKVQTNANTYQNIIHMNEDRKALQASIKTKKPMHIFFFTTK